MVDPHDKSERSPRADRLESDLQRTLIEFHEFFLNIFTLSKSILLYYLRKSDRSFRGKRSPKPETFRILFFVRNKYPASDSRGSSRLFVAQEERFRFPNLESLAVRSNTPQS
jgi:hypothetical protein